MTEQELESQAKVKAYKILADKIIQQALFDLTSKSKVIREDSIIAFLNKDYIQILCELAGINDIDYEIKMAKKIPFVKSKMCIAIRKERRQAIENSILSK